MSVVAFGAVRSCGVTTLALAVAATWPQGRRVLLAELDPAGGTLAAASGWPPQPGLVSLAAAARRGNDPELVWEHCHELPGGVPVLAGPASADQTRTALGMLTGLLDRLGELDADVLLDCGRVVAEPLSRGVARGGPGGLGGPTAPGRPPRPGDLDGEHSARREPPEPGTGRTGPLSRRRGARGARSSPWWLICPGTPTVPRGWCRSRRAPAS